MGFDWFTFVAQLVNFALLLLLLRLFLYRPVLDLMDKRQEQLDSAWGEVRTAESAARAEAEQLAATRAELEGERRRRLEQVETEAASLREKRLQEAEVEAEHERQRRAARFASERGALVNELLTEGAGVLVAELTDSLKELADADLEERAARLFTERLASLTPEESAELRAASGTPVVTTAFEPSASTRALLSGAVRSATGTPAAPTFEVDTGLLFGVALTAGPVRVEASGRRRVANLAAAFDTALDQHAPQSHMERTEDE